MGQQYLYDSMRTLDFDAQKTAQKEKIMEHLTEKEEERLEIQYQLGKLNSKQAYYLVDFFQDEIEQKAKWHYLIPTLSISAILSLIFSFFNSFFLLVFLTLICVHVVIHYSLKRKTNVFINVVPSLLSLGNIAKKLAKKSYLTETYPTLPTSLKTISSIRRKLSIFKLEQKVDSDLEAAYWFLIELIKITFLLEPLLYFSSLDVLRNKSKKIEETFRFVGEIDSLISIISLRKNQSYCKPILDPTAKSVQFEKLRHPLIMDCVPNSIQAQKSFLITGSNMSGKTSFIRSIGLSYIAGMTLNTCFAEQAILPIAKLFSVIRIEDDIMSASSYFFKEVDEIKQIIDQTNVNDTALILLDELFKGTNTLERIASAKAVLSYLSQKKCHVFVSTHDIELTTLLKDKFELVYFSESIDKTGIHFDYKMKSGTPQHGNAIRILEMHDYPTSLVAEAKSIAQNYQQLNVKF